MRKILFGLISVFILILLVGCGYSKEEKKHMKELEKQASKNAVNYIEKKYGFTPTVASTKVEKADTGPIPTLSPDPTGFVFVDLKYNGKDFQVYVSGKEEVNDGYDNYQFNEIVDDLITTITNKTGLKPYNYEVYYGVFYNPTIDYSDIKKSHNGLIKELYNKNILGSVDNLHIKINYINQRNLEFIKNDRVFEKLGIKYESIALYNYYSIDAYNNSTHDAGDVLNVESAYIHSAGLENYYKFNLKNIEGVYYYSGPMNATREISLVETTIVDASSWIGNGAYQNVRQISKAYKVEGLDTDDNTVSKIGVYIPLDSIDGYNINNIRIGIECEGSLSTSSVSKIGDYVYGTVYLNSCLAQGKNDIRFTLLYSTYR